MEEIVRTRLLCFAGYLVVGAADIYFLLFLFCFFLCVPINQSTQPNPTQPNQPTKQLALQKQLAAAQMADSAHRISERNAVEIILKLIESKKVEVL